MKNILQKAGLLLALFIGARCDGYNDDIFNGYNRISTYSTSASDACMLTLQVNTTASAMYFNQTEQLLNNCVNSNITFNSFFKDDAPSTDTLVFNPTGVQPNVTSPITAAFTTAELQKQNGTGCVYLPQSFMPGYDKYFCGLHFSMINVYLEAYGTGNFTFGPVSFSEYSIIPNIENRLLVDSAYVHVDRNMTFPNISASLSESCSAAAGAAIQSLSSKVYITSADLSVLTPNWTLAYTLIKKRTATAVGDYLVRASPSNATLFSSSNGPCWELPITFADLLADGTYCSGSGCQVSLIVDNYQTGVYGSGDVYVIKTNGIVTAATAGTNTGTNTGTGSGAGGSTVVTVNTTNGTGVVVSSAIATVFNACLLLVSLVYLSL